MRQNHLPHDIILPYFLRATAPSVSQKTFQLSNLQLATRNLEPVTSNPRLDGKIGAL